MKVVIATPFREPSEGILGKYASGLAEAFERRGDRVAVCAMVGLRWLPPGLRHGLYFLSVLARSPGASFVLALDTWSVGVPSFLAAKILRRTWMVRVGGDFLWEAYVQRTKEPILLSDFYRTKRAYSLREKLIFSLTRWMLRRADAVLFTTRFQREIWQEAYGIPPEKIHIVENYFPPKAHAGEAMGKLFVSAGRPIALKNADVLEKAFAQVKAKHPEIELDRRPLPFDQHLERLKRAYAVIVPSFSEVCSNTAIEAVSLGKPCIMTRDTGTVERLGGACFYVDTRSQEELANAIERMLDPGTYGDVLTHVRAYTFVHDWDAIAGEIAAILNE